MGTSSIAAEHTSAEVFSWLKTLPVAPEYHPTIQEFQDPISYIFKIEKEASKYGICKIVPPLPSQSKKSVISNFSKSISLLNNSEKNPRNKDVACGSPTFTTRQQQIGFCPRKQRPIHKSVWQSGENYTLQQFEAKAKNFEKNYLKNIVGKGKKTISPLEVETLYWKANGDRPFSVEYANDMPGSAFVPMKEKKAGEVANNVGETAWNMRGVARANGSLLRFMKEEIPGVTSPMVYIAMMFSWFAWHVEDHDLHSLNYLHFGASKTWYGVPRDAALAFEEVIRVHGFGEEINPLVTFATLGEKTTVMSPEVLVKAGVPCCRLVQNAGDFVITFPRAYHSGFSHGFNCGEASNIATPEWLRFAKDAAIRRASINYPPMVSHFQLLYDLALAVCSRVPMSSGAEPRSSRLKDKKKGEGEMLIKQMFVEDVMHNNELLHTLGQGAEVVLLPCNSSEKFVWSNLRVASKYMVKPGLPFSLHGSEESDKASDDIILARDIKQHKVFYSVKAKLNSMSQETVRSETEMRGDGLSDRGLFSCVKCGIWTFACVAIVQPTESTAQYLMSTDCSFFSDWIGGSGVSSHGKDVHHGDTNPSEADAFSGSMEKNLCEGLYEDPLESTDYQIENMDTPSMKSNTAKCIEEGSHFDSCQDSSALGLLAMTYGNSSDSDEDDGLPDRPTVSEENISGDGSWGASSHQDKTDVLNSDHSYDSGMERGPDVASPRSELEDERYPQGSDFQGQSEHHRTNSGDSEFEDHNCSAKSREDNILTSEQNYSPIARERDDGNLHSGIGVVDEIKNHFAHRCDEDSSRMHVFCLEHALEVEKLLQPVGGVHILLLCHPDYPNVQFEAMKVAEELEKGYVWKDIAFAEATKEDEDRIQLALQSEDATPKNGDWAVKLGINLFYSAILSRSPLYSKQMPYNSVIYDAFGYSSPSKTSPGAKFHGKGYGRQRKVVVAGKWCGRVWMSNQVHPSLLQRDLYEEEKAPNFSLSEKRSGRKSETSDKAPVANTNRKIGRKRPVMSKGSRVAKKMKFETVESVDSDPEDPQPEPLPKRSIRNSKSQGRPAQRGKRHEEELPESASEDSPDDEPRQRPWTSARTLKPRSRTVPKSKGQQMETLDAYSDDSLDGKSLNRGLRSCSRKTNMVAKQIRQSKGRAEELVDSESEGSLSDESLQEHENMGSPELEREVHTEFEAVSEDEMDGGPSTRLRKRISKPTTRALENKAAAKKQVSKGKKSPATKNAPPPPPARKGPKMRLPRAPAMKGPARKAPAVSSDTNEEEETEFTCDIEGCTMSFESKQELALHKRNVCPVKGCGKKFFSHKYLVQHRRVHVDDRPLKCPWKGCKMTFKWAWARTEHIRVHTGARPYVCTEPGCGQTFRFVSDFSRHKRKTGHSAKKARK